MKEKTREGAGSNSTIHRTFLLPRPSHPVPTPTGSFSSSSSPPVVLSSSSSSPLVGKRNTGESLARSGIGILACMDAAQWHQVLELANLCTAIYLDRTRHASGAMIEYEISHLPAWILLVVWCLVLGYYSCIGSSSLACLGPGACFLIGGGGGGGGVCGHDDLSTSPAGGRLCCSWIPPWRTFYSLCRSMRVSSSSPLCVCAVSSPLASS